MGKEKQTYLIGYSADDERNPRSSEQDAIQVEVGRRLAISIAKDQGLGIALVADTQRRLTHSPTFGRVFGDQWLRGLVSSGDGTLSGTHVFLVTPQMHTMLHPSVALVLWPQKGTLDHLYGNANIRQEVVVPRFQNEVQSWIDTWGPLHIVGKDDPLPLPRLEIDDPNILQIIDNAMQFGSLGEDEVARARAAFRKLRSKGVDINPAAVRAYVLRNYGHGVAAADKLAKIAAGRPKKS